MDGQRAAPQTAAPDAGSSSRILEAVGFLRQCHRDHLPLVALVGSDVGQIASVVGEFVTALPADTHAARVLAPTDSPQAFLESILAQFGFDPEDLATDDLQRLLLLVMRHCAGETGGALLLVEDAQEFGPRVFEAMREMLRNLPRMGVPPTFVLAGTPSLHKVLDSQAMRGIAHLARWRFDLDVPPPRPQATVAAIDSRPMLQARLSGDDLATFELGERRLLIGRSALSDILLESRFVSRHHALLIPTAGGHWIVDLNSTNGTLVNSRFVHESRLVDGDVISIGNTRLRYRNQGAAAAVEPHAMGAKTLVMRSLRGIRPPGEDSAVNAGFPAA